MFIQEWEQEWDIVVKAAEDRRLDNQNTQPQYGDLLYECLEEIHIFVLANVLKRPIIVLAESVIRGITGTSLAPNNFRGIYLPLLWKPAECVRTPIILAFCDNHFAPLVSIKDMEDLAEDACPLVTFDLESFHIHFLLQHEEGVVHRILQSYLNVTEVTYTRPDGVAMVLAAKMDYEPMPENEDLLRHYMHFAEKQYRDYVRSRLAEKHSITTSSQLPHTPNKEVNQGMGELNLRVNNSEESDQEEVKAGHRGQAQGTVTGKGRVNEVLARKQDDQATIPGLSKPTKLCVVCHKGPAHTRLNGQCSHCYATMATEPAEPRVEKRNELTEPTAPTQSLVTNETPSPSLLELSWRQGSLTNTYVG